MITNDELMDEVWGTQKRITPEHQAALGKARARAAESIRKTGDYDPTNEDLYLEAVTGQEIFKRVAPQDNSLFGPVPGANVSRY